MQPPAPSSAWQALRARVRRAPATPLVTYYDLATGERMELSAASVDNAVAKTAGLLRDELDVTAGDRVCVRLPLHWQRAVWWGACSAVGARFDSSADPVDAVVLATDRAHLELAGAARDTVLVSLEPFGLPSPGPIPAGVIDHAVAARAHPDVFVPLEGPPADEWFDNAEHVIARRGLAGSDRLLVLADDPDADLLMLAVPLALDGSAVLVRHPDRGDLDAIRRAERIELDHPGGA